MRADAQRNCDRIVEVARQVFREQGYDASLDLIAKQAGVGPGTLYRHFPSRDDLIDAVMQAGSTTSRRRPRRRWPTRADRATCCSTGSRSTSG